MAGGLLQRMAALARGEPEPSLAVLVREHLRALLNTRQGSSALEPEYGLPDFTDLVVSFPQGRAQMCAAIASCIRRYEVRLSHVKVEVIEPTNDTERKEALLRFVIHATYINGSGALSLQSSMTPGGRVAVG